jgi:site-specific DNA-methyltransferase (cytosine-N4-specific)
MITSQPSSAVRNPHFLTAVHIGTTLASTPAPQVYEDFARHILISRGGIRVVEGVREMAREGRVITGDSLAEYLSGQGFRVTIHNTAINSLRMWLEKAGVFSAGWTLDDEALARLIGLTPTDIAGLVGLNDEQQAFALALCRINPSGPCSAADVRDMAEQILGRLIPRDSLPKRVLSALRDLGHIEYTTGGTAGGKATQIRTTEKFKRDVLEDFIRSAVRSLDPVLTKYFATTPTDIYTDLGSANKVLRGKALEAYAIHIMRLMGFHFVGWRKRAADTTGQAEVDVVMRGLFGNSPTRWQVQCKNTPGSRVDLEDLSKEVGLVALTNATHVLVIANAPYTKDARTYAAEIMRATPLTIFLLDAHDFEKVRKSPGALAAILRSKSEALAGLKRKTTMWGW